MVVCERIEGSMPRDELINSLRRAVADNEGELVVERTERFRRQEDQQLRQDQDQAFEESLAADKEKQRKKEEDRRRAEQLVREEEEEQRMEEARKEVSRSRCWSAIIYVSLFLQANLHAQLLLSRKLCHKSMFGDKSLHI